MSYGNSYDDVLATLDGAKPAKAGRDPFIAPGSHEGLVISIEMYNDQKWGPTVRGTFEYLSGPLQGQTCAKLWNLKKPSAYPTQETDADNFVDFVCKVQNTTLGQHGAACTALIKTSREHPQGQAEMQPARGVRVRMIGRESGKPNPKTGLRYVAVSWGSVEGQSLATISAARADLDARRPLDAAHAPVQAPVQAPGQYTQQFQAAPVGYANSPAMQQAPQLQTAPTMQPQGGGFGQFVQPTPVAPGLQNFTPTHGNPTGGPAAPQAWPNSGSLPTGNTGGGWR